MRTLFKYILGFVLFLLPFAANAIPDRPIPQKLVNDLADVFSFKQEIELEEKLSDFDKRTSNQIAVVTVNDLEGYEASDYATRIGLNWGVGTEKFDNGIVLLIKPKTPRSPGEVFIAIGYGLEGAVPDAYAKRIIENDLIPNLKNNDYYSGAVSACESLIRLTAGEIPEDKESESKPLPLAFKLFLVFFIAIAVIVTIFGDKDDKNKGRKNTAHIRQPHSYRIKGFGGFGGGSFGGGGAGSKW